MAVPCLPQWGPPTLSYLRSSLLPFILKFKWWDSLKTQEQEKINNTLISKIKLLTSPKRILFVVLLLGIFFLQTLLKHLLNCSEFTANSSLSECGFQVVILLNQCLLRNEETDLGEATLYHTSLHSFILFP